MSARASSETAEAGRPGAPAAATRTGVLLVVSGPSGSGKTTLCRAASEADPECVYSVSCTTRAPRPGETDGADYFFLSEDDFAERAERGEFLEHAEVHGRRYGTLKSWVMRSLEAGIDVVMDIDTQGADIVRRCEDDFIRSALADVFLLPPTLDELKARLAGRATEAADALALRLRNALGEIRRWKSYRYTIISGSRESDLARFLAILQAERSVSARLTLTDDPAGGMAR